MVDYVSGETFQVYESFLLFLALDSNVVQVCKVDVDENFLYLGQRIE